MKKNSLKQKIVGIVLLITLGVMPVFAIGERPEDFTGDSFYTTSIIDDKGNFINFEDSDEKDKIKNNNPNKTIPPVKLIRLKVKAFVYKHSNKDDVVQKAEEALDNEVEISEEQQDVKYYDNEDNLKAKRKRAEKAKNAEQTQITIDCKYMDYLTETGLMTATENVVVTFPHQGTTLSADYLTFDKNTSKMHAEGNVVIQKGGQKTFGESIDIDLNEESMFIAKPVTENPEIKIVAEEGYVQKNVITQIKGQLDVEKSEPFVFRTSGGPDPRQYVRTMIIPEEEKKYITDGKSKIFKIQANEIVINSKENLDVLQLKKARITSGNKTVLKIPRMKIYTSKGHDFFEGNYPEIGARRYLGMYVGPGFVVELPRGCLLKLIPAITYKHKLGVGGVARFWSSTNETQVSYGTSVSKVVVRGEQKLDDNLKLLYSSYDYLDNWFLGRRMPKYGGDIVYRKMYSQNLFTPKLTTTFEHRISGGYFHDMYEDKYYNKLRGSDIGTPRFRYMARLSQPLYKYKNEEKGFYTSLNLDFEGSTALYGTGDTQMIGRFGPHWHIQYKRWMQDIGYRLSAFDDNTPIPVFDKYRYGRSNVYLREYLRVCPYLVLAWQGSVTLTDDTYNNKTFQECSFYASVGPQDLKVNFGYDFVRQNAFINLLLAVDPKGTTVNYDKMVIKNPENFNKLREKNTAIYRAANELPKSKTNENHILTKAIVEEIKENVDDI